MAPKTRAKRAKAGAKDPNPKQTIKPKLYIKTRENDSKNTKRCGHGGASVRLEDTENALQDTANAAANVSAEPLISIQPAEPRESSLVPSAAVLPEWIGRRRRSGLEVADFFRRRWALWAASIDELVAAADTMVQMKNDPNDSAPLKKKSRSKRKLTRQGHRSQGHDAVDWNSRTSFAGDGRCGQCQLMNWSPRRIPWCR